MGETQFGAPSFTAVAFDIDPVYLPRCNFLEKYLFFRPIPIKIDCSQQGGCIAVQIVNLILTGKIETDNPFRF